MWKATTTKKLSFSLGVMTQSYGWAWGHCTQATHMAATVKTVRYCTQTKQRKATGRRGSLNTNHCGVLAAGRRKGDAHLGNEVKGILSLCQILQGENDSENEV